MLYVFKNDSLDPHLPALQLKFPGIGHTLRGAILSADPAERAVPVPEDGGAGAGWRHPSANPAERAPVPSYPIPIARLIRMTSKSSEREADKKLVKRHTSISGLLRVSIVWFYKAAKRACLSGGNGYSLLKFGEERSALCPRSYEILGVLGGKHALRQHRSSGVRTTPFRGYENPLK